MFCAVCEAEFVAGITQCSDCDVPLVSTLPDEEAEQDRDEVRELPGGPLVRVPLANASDAPLVQSLLQSAGFQYQVIGGYGDPDEVLVREEDVNAIKEFLEDYRSQHGWGNDKVPIQW